MRHPRAITVLAIVLGCAVLHPPVSAETEYRQAHAKRIAAESCARLLISDKPHPIGLLVSVAPSVRVQLPALSMDKIRAEDDVLMNAEKGMMRIGVFQEIPGTIVVDGPKTSHGFWIPLAGGGFLWAVTIYAPGAIGQRIEFSGLGLSQGAQLRVYNAATPEECYDPVAAGLSPLLWTPTCFGEETVIECYVDRADAIDGVRITVDRIAHIYQSASDIVSKGTAGSCNIDITCHPAWAEAALAVGGMGIIGNLGVFFCTCALIAHAQECTEIPYVLTANHCVRQQGGSYGAEYLEFYWRYQTPSCNGTPPSPATVPRTTGGADYLAGLAGRGDTGGGNDFTFMRMRNLPPAGLSYLGWTTETIPVGAPVTCIHHPRGDFKRISFGAKTSIANTYPQLFHEVVWSDGTTEPGSSGSPLLLSATSQIIGQLWGGGASCATPQDPDYYGRFNVTYGYIAAYIDPGPATVGFLSSVFEVIENESPAVITVQLSAPSAGGVTVEYAATPGTALPGVDFHPVSGTLDFPRGQQYATFSVPILGDDEYIGDRTVILTLSNLSCPLLDPAAAVATLTIIDDEPESVERMSSLPLPWPVEN